MLAEAARSTREELLSRLAACRCLTPPGPRTPAEDLIREEPRPSMTLVVDASVAFKWFAQENGTDRALHLLERGEPIVAPDLILAEVCNAAWKSLRRGELAPPQFDAILTDIAEPFSPAWCRSTS